MNRQVYLNHLELRKTGQTFFHFNKEKYNVKDAPPQIFDQWIRQFVERIVNVDIAKWDTFQRWNIINAVLTEGIITIATRQDEDIIERHFELKSEVHSEDFSSDSELLEPVTAKSPNHSLVRQECLNNES